jgi:hypothetical protein
VQRCLLACFEASLFRSLTSLLRHSCHQGVSASPASEDNLFVWTATVFVRFSLATQPTRALRPLSRDLQGPDDTPWEV